jgi:hypothetical protein
LRIHSAKLFSNLAAHDTPLRFHRVRKLAASLIKITGVGSLPLEFQRVTTCAAILIEAAFCAVFGRLKKVF